MRKVKVKVFKRLNRGCKLFRFQPKLRQWRPQQMSLYIITSPHAVVGMCLITKGKPKSCIFGKALGKIFSKHSPTSLSRRTQPTKNATELGRRKTEEQLTHDKNTDTHAEVADGNKRPDRAAELTTIFFILHPILLTGPTGRKWGRPLVCINYCTIMARPNSTGRVSQFQ